MPLKLSTNGKGTVTLTWTSSDTKMEATWRLNARDEEIDVLETLEKVTRFVRAQRGEHEKAVIDLGKQIMGPDWSPQPSATAGASAGGAERIPMGPAHPSDLPAGGAPISGWAQLVGGNASGAPQLPPHAQDAGWEFIPPGE